MAAAKPLPQKPSAEHLRKEAKRVARRSAIRLSTAQHRLAREYGYRNWTELIVAVEMIARSRTPGGSGAGGPQPPSPPPHGDASTLVPLLPLRGLVAFPHDAFPIYVGRQTSIDAVRTAGERGGAILLVAQKDPYVGDAAKAELYEVGTLGAIREVAELPDSTLKIIVEGQKRARIKRVTFEKGFAEAEVEEVAEAEIEVVGEMATAAPKAEMKSGAARLVSQVLVAEVLSAWDKREGDYPRWIEQAKLRKPSEVADIVASHLAIEIAEKQALLETADPIERLRKILAHIKV